MPNIECTEIGPYCPVEATTYGYYPVLWANTILLVIFAVALCCQIVIGLTTKVYSYSISIGIGCLIEVAGYSGRIIMNNNPWDSAGFRMQIVCLIIGPSFIAAGIYLTLKHMVYYHGPQYSLLKPLLYTWIFIGCDVGSILLQAAGGGIAGSAADDMELLKVGNNIMIAGIAFQVATMNICGILAADFVLRRYRQRLSSVPVAKPLQSGGWKSRAFQVAVCFAFATVLIRSIYRLPEMAGGWGNPRMRHEPEFLALDGLMIALAAIALTAFHLAFLFPAMRTDYRAQGEKDPASPGEWIPLSNRNMVPENQSQL